VFYVLYKLAKNDISNLKGKEILTTVQAFKAKASCRAVRAERIRRE